MVSWLGSCTVKSACYRRSALLQAWVYPPIQLPANAHLGTQQLIIQVAGFLPLLGETWIESQVLGFYLVQPQLQQFEKWTSIKKIVSPSVIVPFKLTYIKKNFLFEISEHFRFQIMELKCVCIEEIPWFLSPQGVILSPVCTPVIICQIYRYAIQPR